MVPSVVEAMKVPYPELLERREYVTRIIRAEADAESAKIYADAFGKDAEFYDFYRAMQSYDATFANPENEASSSILLSPDNEYLRQFRGR